MNRKREEEGRSDSEEEGRSDSEEEGRSGSEEDINAGSESLSMSGEDTDGTKLIVCLLLSLLSRDPVPCAYFPGLFV